MTASEVKDKLEQATRLYVQADKEGNKASKLTMIQESTPKKTWQNLQKTRLPTQCYYNEEKIRDLRLRNSKCRKSQCTT